MKPIKQLLTPLVKLQIKLRQTLQQALLCGFGMINSKLRKSILDIVQTTVTSKPPEGLKCFNKQNQIALLKKRSRSMIRDSGHANLKLNNFINHEAQRLFFRVIKISI